MSRVAMVFQARSLVVGLLIGTAACVGGCTAPRPGPNAGAQAAPGSAPPPTQVTVGQEIGAVAINKVEVTFPAGATALSAGANHQLDLASRLFRDVDPVLMFATGYSDRRGDEYANLILSARRAEAVKRGLVARGIPADRLLIRALGASDPADPAAPLSSENRRVVVTWRLVSLNGNAERAQSTQP